MDAYRRTSTLRRVATTASLAALVLIPAGPADAARKKVKSPVVTGVSPMRATVGETLVIKGRNFRKGKGRNSVGFKRDGSAVVFVKSGLSTTRKMTVKLPSKLEQVMFGTSQTFRLRVLAGRFGTSYTPKRLSPTIAPRPATPEPGAPGTGGTTGPGGTIAPGATDPHADSGDCDGDKVKNGEDADDDNDNLSDALENQIGTDTCLADTDKDGVVDGYEYRSAIDLNDDEYQSPNASLPFPGKRPYPNALYDKDANLDFDGDGLTLTQEQKLWMGSTPPAQRTFELPAGSKASSPLNYSDGLQYSVSEHCPSTTNPQACAPSDNNLRVPTLASGESYVQWQDFKAWATREGYYPKIRLHDLAWTRHTEGRFDYSPLDVNRDGTESAAEKFPLDRDGDGWLSDDERDADADGLGNQVEFNGQMQAEYWEGCYKLEAVYPVPYAGTDATLADTDGDGVRDGADDEDHDDLPNMMELSRMRASQLDDTEAGKVCTPNELLKVEDPNHPDEYGFVNPFNPCLPDYNSRTCTRYVGFGGKTPAPFAGPVWYSLQ